MRVVIGEDSALFRDALAALLASAGHDIVGRAATGAAAVAQARAHNPDVVVLDIRMPRGIEGVEAATEIRQWRPGAPVVLLSQHVETRLSAELIGSGAIGYLLKDRVLDVDEFLDALERVAQGGTALDPEIVARLITPHRSTAALAGLTPRERDVLGLMAEGLTNAAIGRRLFLSLRTVETHIASIFAKLRVPESEDAHRRVRAILAYLDDQAG